MNRRLLMILAVAGAGIVTAVARKESAPLTWPDNGDALRLKFSHELHVKQNGMACLDCHGAAKTSELATDNLRPTHDNCATCHSDQVTSTCGYCHVNPDSIEPAPRPVREITFSHAKHVAMEGVECATCHQNIEDTTVAGPQNMPAMSACTSCHNDKAVSAACEACHTNFANLIPQDHLAGMFRQDHKRLTRLGSLDVSCATCHTQNFCADCHGATALLQIGKGGLMAEPSPRMQIKDSPKTMNLLAVHPLDYKFTHGVDAKAKSTDCYSCHSEQTFCSECHAAGNAIDGSLQGSPRSGWVRGEVSTPRWRSGTSRVARAVTMLRGPIPSASRVTRIPTGSAGPIRKRTRRGS